MGCAANAGLQLISICKVGLATHWQPLAQALASEGLQQWWWLRALTRHAALGCKLPLEHMISCDLIYDEDMQKVRLAQLS